MTAANLSQVTVCIRTVIWSTGKSTIWIANCGTRVRSTIKGVGFTMKGFLKKPFWCLEQRIIRVTNSWQTLSFYWKIAYPCVYLSWLLFCLLIICQPAFIDTVSITVLSNPYHSRSRWRLDTCKADAVLVHKWEKTASWGSLKQQTSLARTDHRYRFIELVPFWHPPRMA